MTREEFDRKHKKNVKLGFDTIDGADIWREFTADLDELIKSEREACAKTAASTNCDYGVTHGHCECGFQAGERIRATQAEAPDPKDLCTRCGRQIINDQASRANSKMLLRITLCVACFTSNA